MYDFLWASIREEDHNISSQLKLVIKPITPQPAVVRMLQAIKQAYAEGQRNNNKNKCSGHYCTANLVSQQTTNWMKGDCVLDILVRIWE